MENQLSASIEVVQRGLQTMRKIPTSRVFPRLVFTNSILLPLRVTYPIKIQRPSLFNFYIL